MSEGWHGWDRYAPFYDWENAQTVARRDVAFWRNLARQHPGTVLELGCGTGRLSLPLLKSGADLVGVDRSEAMLNRLRLKARRAGLAGEARVVRGDIRRLPFRTLSVPQMRRRLEKAGFRVDAVLGDYRGGPWHPDADVWILLTSRA